MSGKRSLVFATNNANKLREIRDIVGDVVNILSLNDIDCHEELPETSDTIRGNALQKARYVSEHYGVDCFADDTGLEVKALGGAPGVHTARYASAEGHDSMSNMALLLSNLEGEADRSARFVTVIALVSGGKETLFEGVCDGKIATEKSGSAGFGYDPIFIPAEGGGLTFAQMDHESKNRVSHRGKATRLLIEELRNCLKMNVKL